jgi:calpain-7
VSSKLHVSTYAVSAKHTVHFSARLQLAEATDTPINLTVFKRNPGGALGDQVVSSGPYSNAASGVLVPTTRFEPGIYVVVASTYSAGFWGSFKLSVYGSGVIDLTAV